MTGFEVGFVPGLNFSRFCGTKFGRPSSVRAIFALTASRRVVGRVSLLTARSVRSAMNFAARDCGFAPTVLKVLFGFSKVRSSRVCFGLPLGAPSMCFDFEAVRS